MRLFFVYFYLHIVAACASVNYSASSSLNECADCRTLIINDPALVTGMVSYPVEGLDFWIVFPDRSLAVHAVKPSLHNNSFSLIFRFNPSDTGLVIILTGNSFGGGKVRHYVDTIFAIRDLNKVENIFEVSRLPKRVGPGVWEPALSLHPAEKMIEKQDGKSVILHYSLTEDKTWFSRWKRLIPSKSNFDKFMQRYYLGKNSISY